jgi:hypothetical protein
MSVEALAELGNINNNFRRVNVDKELKSKARQSQ